MSILIVVADASRARFMTAETRKGPLIESSDFVHNASRQREQQLTSDAKGTGKDATGYGNHSMGHENESHKLHKESFARELSAEIDKVLQTGETGRIYILAAPVFLGMLRKFLSKQAMKIIAGEVQKDLVSHRIEEIRSHLPILL